MNCLKIYHLLPIGVILTLILENCAPQVMVSYVRVSSAMSDELVNLEKQTFSFFIDEVSQPQEIAQQLLELCENEAIRNGIKVQVRYKQLKQILEQEKLSYSDFFNPQTRTALGKKLGVTILGIILTSTEEVNGKEQLFVGLKFVNIETGSIVGLVNLLKSPIVYDRGGEPIDGFYTSITSDTMADSVKNLFRDMSDK